MTVAEFLEQHDIEVAPDRHHHSRPGWLQFDCPWCSPKAKRWRMGFNINNRYTNCWACGPHRLIPTLAELVSKSTKYVARLLGDDEDLPDATSQTKPRGRYSPPQSVPLATCLRHRKYLEGRGFDWEEVSSLWRVTAIRLHSKYAWRLLIPVYFQGEAVSWTTRSVSDTIKKRYDSATADKEKIDHKTLLYGEDYATHGITIHEGPLDVWKVGPGAVCTFGTGFSRAQILRMVKYPVRAVCFDNEPTAQRRAAALCRELEVFPGETYNVALNAKDAGNALPRELKQLRERFLK